ncbi:S66 peptidase family protein [Mucilaginibacter ginkgonis]|uniref:LD-carboxypeptidase n=1 Tax=Mucilaginibacter ginkgonis TaxID=2682091 RepID=A0A6I4I2L1_9SPHI|nr:LD-carboxypeptidase [Mucilaginibacter ginkgonis]QQL49143.1 LD-carboxypeptidase [Mucilaginibacter ginkgonis]
MSISPPYLKKGDLVAIICPAKKPQTQMDDALALLRSWGLRVVLGDTLSATWHQFAGDDALRTADMQKFIDDTEVKAIFAARGGYGTVRIIDEINFDVLKTNPKWLVGFSDITVLHSHVWANYGLQSIHGQMPVNIPDASTRSLENLRKALFGEELSYQFNTREANRPGSATAEIIGGNLSLLVNILASASDFDYSGKILFLEDVGEYLYSIDRMLYTLKRAGKLKHLAGLIIGGFTGLKDNDIPFGFTVPQIVMNLVKDYDYPVAFDFPAGHVDDNNALILGREATLQVNTSSATLKFSA